MSASLLIIDHHEHEREFLRDVMELEGYSVSVAGTAFEAIAITQEEPPDAILLEGDMPSLDGIDLLLRFKASLRETDPAIVMIANSSRDDKIIAALELGATDFIPKPFSAALIRARLRNALRVRNLQVRTRRQKEKAEHDSTLKAAFLANMSHEIRTPMTAILGFADILYFEGDQSQAPPHRLEAIRIIKRNAQHLLGLINDILDLSKVEAGKLEVAPHRCSAIQTISDVLTLLRPRAEEKNLSLLLQCKGLLPESTHTDPNRLRQILINLLSNAIKFTEQGSVTLAMELIDDQTEEPKLQFQVIDTGIGISPKEQEQIFQPFSQATPYTTRTYGGTGLGLSISMQLAQMLGGEVTVESQLNQGSVFTLTIATGSLEGVALIDYATADTPINQAKLFGTPLATDELDCRILLVEDGADNQRLLTHVLNRAGASVVVADHGQMAVELVEAAHDEGKPFDLILMDMQMPIMDGFAATERIRQLGHSLPIIALTAFAMSSDRKRCLEAGCNSYATKPIDRKQLLERVRHFLHVPADQEEVEADSCESS